MSKQRSFNAGRAGIEAKSLSKSFTCWKHPLKLSPLLTSSRFHRLAQVVSRAP